MVGENVRDFDGKSVGCHVKGEQDREKWREKWWQKDDSVKLGDEGTSFTGGVENVPRGTFVGGQ